MTLVPAPTISRTSQKRSRLVEHHEPARSCRPPRPPQPVEGAHDGELRALDRREARHGDQRVEFDRIAGEQLAGALCLRAPVDRPAIGHGQIVHHEIFENGQ
jgi:hypothetical protein